MINISVHLKLNEMIDKYTAVDNIYEDGSFLKITEEYGPITWIPIANIDLIIQKDEEE